MTTFGRYIMTAECQGLSNPHNKPRPIDILTQRVSSLESRLLRMTSDLELMKTSNRKLVLDKDQLKKELKESLSKQGKENTSWWWS